jgi:hypothetical protein
MLFGRRPEHLAAPIYALIRMVQCELTTDHRPKSDRYHVVRPPSTTCTAHERQLLPPVTKLLGFVRWLAAREELGSSPEEADCTGASLAQDSDARGLSVRRHSPSTGWLRWVLAREHLPFDDPTAITPSMSGALRFLIGRDELPRDSPLRSDTERPHTDDQVD